MPRPARTPWKILLRLFVMLHGQKVILLLHGYDKSRNDKPLYQQQQIKIAKVRAQQCERNSGGDRRPGRMCVTFGCPGSRQFIPSALWWAWRLRRPSTLPPIHRRPCRRRRENRGMGVGRAHSLTRTQSLSAGTSGTWPPSAQPQQATDGLTRPTSRQAAPTLPPGASRPDERKRMTRNGVGCATVAV